MNERDAELRSAAYNNRLNRTKALLKLGANPNATDEDGQTALHAAVAWFQPPMSDMIVRWYTEPEVLEALLDAGALLNIRDKEGMTPLLLACRNANGPAALFLLERGADPKELDRFGWSALTWQLWKGRWWPRKTRLEGQLLKHGAVLTLWDALLQGNLPLAEQLVERAPLTPIGPYKTTLLHLAARAGSLRVTESLLRRDADVQAADIWNQTVLHFALGGYKALSIPAGSHSWHRFGLQKDRDRLVTLLLKVGAQLNVRASDFEFDPTDPSGETPLEWALGLQNVGLMRLLLKAGADPNQKSEYGEPILFDAISTKNAEIVKVLLDAGADPAVRVSFADRDALSLAKETPKIERLVRAALKRRGK
ncbi:ankyrin repeat domain-containing protein [Armatimonas sp.]|uniref:ankyrin repeat domain-containing protein n=1 Tax=Armatimonas sp. TaxID=1872638 RepID=UPI00286B07DB|nr:ankyrin repeat domain-containing protein [Armatimonas sp.]